MTTQPSAVRIKLAAGDSTPRDFESHARQLIRQRPVVAVLSAMGIGYLLARLVLHGSR